MGPWPRAPLQRRDGEETLGTAGPETPALLALLSLPPGTGEAPRSGLQRTPAGHRQPALSPTRAQRRWLRAREAAGPRPPADAASGHVPPPDPADPQPGQGQGHADKREHSGPFSLRSNLAKTGEGGIGHVFKAVRGDGLKRPPARVQQCYRSKENPTQV